MISAGVQYNKISDLNMEWKYMKENGLLSGKFMTICINMYGSIHNTQALYKYSVRVMNKRL